MIKSSLENNNLPSSKIYGRKSISAILLKNKIQDRSSMRKLTLEGNKSIKKINDNSKENEMNNKNYLLNKLAKNLIRNTYNEEEYIKLRKEETPEYIINWKLIKDPNMITYNWKNMGLIKLTKELLNEVSKMSPEEAKNCDCIYKKRIWLHLYITSIIPDLNKENPLIIVDRNNILNLLKTLQIHFVNEIAHDEGGVCREWYSSLFKQFFNEKNNLFIENPYNSSFNGTFIINLKYNIHQLDYFLFFGKLIVKAIIDSVHMNEHLNLTIIKYLLNKQVRLEEMKFYDLSIYKSLKKFWKVT